MRIKLYGSLVVIATLIFFQAQAQQTAKVSPAGTSYWEYLPQGYNSNSDKYPVVISLHGVGEKGSDINNVAKAGLPSYVKGGQQYPFILISPQLKSSIGLWSGTYVMEVVNYVKTKLRVDPSRIYLTGFSLGGYGVWKVVAAYPDVFAAIVPICSGGNAMSSACTIASNNVPIWAFHGDADKTVSYQVSLKMVNAVNACTPKPSPLAKITIYPGLSHGIWGKVYKESTALNWMLGFRKGSAPSPTPDPESNIAPIVSAGTDKAITLPTSTVDVQGSATDSDGSITSYAWSKVSGGAASLSGTTSATLHAYNLVSGTYYFRLTVKDNKGLAKSDDVKVTVGSSSTNKLPVVSAGSNKTIYLPDDDITLVGTASDPDGSIASYQWTKLSGGNVILNNTWTSKLWVDKTQPGTYTFRLTVKDNNGAVRYDDVTLTVKSSTASLVIDDESSLAIRNAK